MNSESRPFWLRPSFAILLLVFLTLLINWPYMLGGFYADDFMLINCIEMEPRPFSRWAGIWSGTAIDGFDSVWWKDPDWQGTFWRPLPSLLLESSLWLFGRNAFPLHLLSILLHAAVTVGLYILTRKLTRSHWLALLAGLFYVSCDDLSFVIGWIATFTDIICVFFILLALLWHLYWLETRRNWTLVASLVAIAMAMTCKETAVVAPVAIVLLSIFVDRRSDASDATELNLRARLAAAWHDRLCWLPATLLLVAYLTFYTGMQYGVMNNLFYVSPVTDPVRYMTHLVAHLPVLWLSTLTVIPPSVLWIYPDLIVWMGAAGLFAFLLWVAALRSFRKHAIVWWAMLLYLLTLLPQLGTDASERALYFPMIPASILLAYLVISIGVIVRRIASSSQPTTRTTRIMGWTAMLALLLPSIVISIWRPWVLIPAFERPDRELQSGIALIREHRPEHAIILNASGWGLTFYAWDIVNYHMEQPQNVWLLSSASGVFSLEKTSDSSFVVRSDRPGWLNNVFARVLRTTETLELNRRYVKTPFTATILELTDDGTDILAAQFEFNRPLSHRSWLFLRWNGRKFENMDVATLAVGQKVELGDTSDLWKSMM